MSASHPSYAMSGTPALRIEWHLAVIALVSLAMLGYAAATHDKLLAAIGALLFTQRLVFTGIRATAGGQKRGAANDDALPPLKVLQNTTRLTAHTMLWAAAAFLIAYPIAGLEWQHGWQYGAGAALLAVAFYLYALRLHETGNRLAQAEAVEGARRLSMAFAAAVAGGAAWLIASGKLATLRSDWLANDIFLALSASILSLSVLCIFRARRR